MNMKKVLRTTLVLVLLFCTSAIVLAATQIQQPDAPILVECCSHHAYCSHDDVPSGFINLSECESTEIWINIDEPDVFIIFDTFYIYKDDHIFGECEYLDELFLNGTSRVRVVSETREHWPDSPLVSGFSIAPTNACRPAQHVGPIVRSNSFRMIFHSSRCAQGIWPTVCSYDRMIFWTCEACWTSGTEHTTVSFTCWGRE